uniref:Uncharacterized protein n=1 Tax=Panagrolaimus sp. PS1159 TaxID=55785 RepID=A0AC35F7Z3_9BILA
MYKITAYRITLRQRYQILENIKVLRCLFPAILLHTLISPLGSIILIINSFYPFIKISAATMYIFYNLALLLICLRHFYIFYKNDENQEDETSTVENALGKRIPTSFSSEHYFKNLQQHWY